MRRLPQDVNNRLQSVEVDLVECRHHGRVEVKDADGLVSISRLKPQWQHNLRLGISVTG